MEDLKSFPQEKMTDKFWAELYDEYYPKVYKYTLYRVGNPHIAEDMVSEVFEKVFHKYYTYNPRISKFNTWLFTIANNTIINHYKKNNHHYAVVNIEKMEVKYQLEEIVLEKELKEKLINAIMCLDERQRNIIALKFAAGQTNREIGLMLNLSESNVGTILYRSLKYLKDILKEQDD